MNRETVRGLPLCVMVVLVALLNPASQATADPSLGRLFSTPEERARLDQARRRARLPPAPAATEAVELARPEPPEAPTVPPPPRTALAVDGYVIRGDAGATVWVNRESSTGGPLLGVDAVVEPPLRPGVGVRLHTADGTSLTLRPGQSLPAGEDIVRERFLESPGTASVRAQPPGSSAARGATGGAAASAGRP